MVENYAFYLVEYYIQSIFLSNLIKKKCFDPLEIKIFKSYQITLIQILNRIDLYTIYLPFPYALLISLTIKQNKNLIVQITISGPTRYYYLR